MGVTEVAVYTSECLTEEVDVPSRMQSLRIVPTRDDVFSILLPVYRYLRGLEEHMGNVSSSPGTVTTLPDTFRLESTIEPLVGDTLTS